MWILAIAGLFIALCLGLVIGYWGIKIQDWVTAISAIAAAVSAYAAHRAVHEMRVDRNSRYQPHVIVEFEAKHNGALFLLIRNVGNGNARNVTFEFEPVPIDYHGARLTDLPIFQNPIPLMFAGNEIRYFFHTTTPPLWLVRVEALELVAGEIDCEAPLDVVMRVVAASLPGGDDVA